MTPSIAVDPIDPQRLYVSWASFKSSGTSDVFVSTSSDGGISWRDPVMVDDRVGGAPHNEFMPWIVVDDNGVVRVAFGDTRAGIKDDHGDFLYDIYIAASADHARLFGPNARVTTQSLDPWDSNYGSEPFIGDYFNMAPCGTPIWTDTRNGHDDIYAGYLAGVSDCAAAAQAPAPSPSPVATSNPITRPTAPPDLAPPHEFMPPHLPSSGSFGGIQSEVVSSPLPTILSIALMLCGASIMGYAASRRRMRSRRRRRF